MAKEFKLPELGENIESADIVKVLVSPGDSVEQDQAVLEIETDKAALEVPSTVEGTVDQVQVSDGDKVHVGQVVFTLKEDSSAEEQEAESEEEPEEEREKEEAPKKEPSEEEETERKKEAAEEKEEAKEEQQETEKKEGEEETQAEEEERKETREAPSPKQQEPERDHVPAPAAPSVRRLAREFGLDINKIPGSGPGGRISAEDVKKYSRELRQQPETGPSVEAVSLPDFSQWGEIEREPMSKIRRITARRMSQSWRSVPHVVHYDTADVTELERHREEYGKKVEAAGGKLTVTAILLKVTASALQVFPQFKASVDMSKEEIIYKKYCHIGLAVDTDRGLLVPVIRDVDKKNITQISVELSQIAEKTRSGKISLEEMQGGCFTITNLGGIGGTSFAPIVYAPEVAILGVSRSRVEPVFRDGQFYPRTVMPLSLSYDHRAIDGANAARFVRWIAEALENPFKILLEG